MGKRYTMIWPEEQCLSSDKCIVLQNKENSYTKTEPERKTEEKMAPNHSAAADCRFTCPPTAFIDPQNMDQSEEALRRQREINCSQTCVTSQATRPLPVPPFFIAIFRTSRKPTTTENICWLLQAILENKQSTSGQIPNHLSTWLQYDIN